MNSPGSYPYPSYPYRFLPQSPSPRWKTADYLAIFLGSVTLFLLIMPLLLVAALYLYFILYGLIFPAIQIGTIPIGGLTPARAIERVNAGWQDDRTLLLSDGEQVWSASPADFGLWIDVDEAVQQAYQIGRGPKALSQWLQTLQKGAWVIRPRVSFNPEIARLQLEALAPLVSRPPQPAALQFENSRWRVIPGRDGQALNVDATLQQMMAQPRLIAASGYLQLITTPVTSPLQEASPALRELEEWLNRPLKIQAYDPILDEWLDWEVPPQEFAAWVQLGQDGDALTALLDPKLFGAYLQQQQSRLGPNRSFDMQQDPSEALKTGNPVTIFIQHEPTTYLVQPGDTLVGIALKAEMPYWKILEANPGLTESTLYAGQQIVIPSKNELLPLPIVPNKRIVISISEQRLRTYENGQLRDEQVISTGIPSSPTLPGVYQVQTHESLAYASVWDLYMPHFLGIYEGWPGFMNGIHGLPTLSSGQRMWANSLGRPASYGCIILTLQAAEDLYNWAEDGVVVEIDP